MKTRILQQKKSSKKYSKLIKKNKKRSLLKNKGHVGGANVVAKPWISNRVQTIIAGLDTMEKIVELNETDYNNMLKPIVDKLNCEIKQFNKYPIPSIKTKLDAHIKVLKEKDKFIKFINNSSNKKLHQDITGINPNELPFPSFEIYNEKLHQDITGINPNKLPFPSFEINNEKLHQDITGINPNEINIKTVNDKFIQFYYKGTLFEITPSILSVPELQFFIDNNKITKISENYFRIKNKDTITLKLYETYNTQLNKFKTVYEDESTFTPYETHLMFFKRKDNKSINFGIKVKISIDDSKDILLEDILLENISWLKIICNDLNKDYVSLKTSPVSQVSKLLPKYMQQSNLSNLDYILSLSQEQKKL